MRERVSCVEGYQWSCVIGDRASRGQTGGKDIITARDVVTVESGWRKWVRCICFVLCSTLYIGHAIMQNLG